ncbi:MAG TPA: LptA/OstA family protein [Polyangiaceae bacterium]|nr:LptA/OstA family protein [Polyangiaceae bacterium]
MRLPRKPLVALVAALVAVATLELPRAQVASADSLGVVEGQALDVSAERLDVDVERGTALLQGSVSAKLGDLEVHCPTVEIRYDRSPRISFAKGTGGVTARLKGIDATATTVEFEAASRTVTLDGNVRLSRGKGWVTAEHATVDVATGKVSLQEVKGSIPVEAEKR